MDENFFALAGGDESEFIKTDLGKSYAKLMMRGSELFNKDESRNFCLTLGDESTLKNSVQESNDSDGFDCNCVASLCPQCPSYLVCESEICLRTSDNCGCFAIWLCTKKCSVGLPIEAG